MSWPSVKLADVCNVIMGQAPEGSSYNEAGEGIPLLAGAGDFGEKTPTPKKFTTEASKLSQSGDLILCIRATIGDLNWSDRAYCLGRGVAGLRVIEDKLDASYLWHFICTHKHELASKGTGSTFKQVNRTHIAEWEIPLPTLPEQKRIAAILDKADAIRRKRQQAIQLADDFLRAVFLDMFGDPGANPKGFNEAALGELTTGKMNNGLFRKNDEYGGSVPVAWVGELFRGNKISFSEDANRIDPTGKEIEAYGLKYGDLLFCRSSLKLEGVGFNNIYLGDDDKALFECHLIRMSPCLEKVNPIFLNYQLRMPSVRARIFQQAKTSTMTTIDQAGLSRIKVFVPPLGLQEEFERRLVKVESLYSHLCKNKSLDDLAFSSLSQKAFSGQL